MTGVGHFASAFLIKSKFQKIPFWILLLSTEIIELFWVILTLNLWNQKEPIEFVHINLPFQYIGDMILSKQPISHSLIGSMVISLVFSVIFYLIYKEKQIFPGFLLGGIGHWFLDFLVHDADLTLFGFWSEGKIGPLFHFDSSHPEQGFYSTSPLFGFLFQTLFVFFCSFLYYKNKKSDSQNQNIKFWILILLANSFSLGVFVRGMMTPFILSNTWMSVLVLMEIIYQGLIFYMADKILTNKPI